MNRRAALAALLGAALAFACGKTERSSRTHPSDSVPGAAAKEGARIGDLPADFPKDVPVLKGATVKVAMAQGKRMVVHLSTSSPVAEAAKFYNDAFRNEGWQIESSAIASDVATLSARKGRTLCGVTVSREGRGSLVRLSVVADGA